MSLREEQLNHPNNLEKVLYCTKCLSLRIRNVSSINNSDYCDICGNTNIAECYILEWEQMYIDRYGHRYLDEY